MGLRLAGLGPCNTRTSRVGCKVAGIPRGSGCKVMGNPRIWVGTDCRYRNPTELIGLCRFLSRQLIKSSSKHCY